MSGPSSGRSSDDAAESIASHPAPLVGVVMGSASDYENMAPACEILAELGIPYEARVVSAHRTPDWLFEYAESAAPRGLQVIIAGAGRCSTPPGNACRENVGTGPRGSRQCDRAERHRRPALHRPNAGGRSGWYARHREARRCQCCTVRRADPRAEKPGASAKLTKRRSTRAAEALARPLNAPGAIEPS